MEGSTTCVLCLTSTCIFVACDNVRVPTDWIGTKIKTETVLVGDQIALRWIIDANPGVPTQILHNQWKISLGFLTYSTSREVDLGGWERVNGRDLNSGQYVFDANRADLQRIIVMLYSTRLELGLCRYLDTTRHKP